MSTAVCANGGLWRSATMKQRVSVWFRVHFGHQRLTRLCRRMTDAVDKVGDEQRAGNNRIQVPSFLNSILRARLLS